MLLRSDHAVRIGLRNRVSAGTRDAVFGAAVLTALAHAGYVSLQTPEIPAVSPNLFELCRTLHGRLMLKQISCLGNVMAPALIVSVVR